MHTVINVFAFIGFVATVIVGYELVMIVLEIKRRGWNL